VGLLSLLPLLGRFGVPGLLVFGAIVYFGGGDLFGGSSEGLHGEGQQQERALSGEDPEAPMVQFVSFVLDDAQQTWKEQFARSGARAYEPAVLVLFRGRTSSACGSGAAAMGPFYCPTDRRAYIDLSFYRDLRQRFGAPGDFAQAYVIAHELGHHVQNLLGISTRVHRAAESEQGGASGLSVRLELQADCFAGIWAHATRERKLLESGDIEEALTAASAIGDDRLQKQASGTVAPDSFTHGSSEQRVRWLRRGLETGDIKACDTFSPSLL